MELSIVADNETFASSFIYEYIRHNSFNWNSGRNDERLEESLAL